MVEPSVELAIPWGGSDEDQRHRSRCLQFVFAYASESFPDWHPNTWDDFDEPFRRGALCNEIALRSTADVIVFLDADSIVRPTQLRSAAERAAETRGAVRAYTTYSRLSEPATRRLTHWNDVFTAEINWEQENTVSHGAFAVHRQTFVDLGGYDPRFVYFYDDCSFDIRADHVHQERVPGHLYHLWHQARVAPDEDEALWRRYEHEDPEAVRAEAGFPV